MKHSATGAAALTSIFAKSITACSFFALASACVGQPEQDINKEAPTVAVAPKTHQAKKAGAAAEAKAEECGAPSEDCGCKDDAQAANGSFEIVDVKAGSSPSRGPAGAPVTIVVFSDFQCPFCRKGEAIMAELEALYPGKLRFVFKNNPLPFHKDARPAAKAALAAAEQGKFWEYHDALFASTDGLEPAALERRATEVGLDVERFRRAMSSDALDTAIDADIEEAKRISVKGTPAFFVNGRRLVGTRPISEFRAAVDDALDPRAAASRRN